MEIQRTKIGYLVGGGLKENFRVRLTVSPQEIQEGAFVVIQSGDWNYYGIVVDIVLGATDQRFADEQSGACRNVPRIGFGDHVFHRFIHNRRRFARWLIGRSASDLPLQRFADQVANIIPILFRIVAHAPLPPAASSQSGSS